MFANPGRMHANLVGMDRLRPYIQYELFRRTADFRIDVVAERKVTEFHHPSPFQGWLQSQKRAIYLCAIAHIHTANRPAMQGGFDCRLH